jgi:hypothetical protein
MRSEQPRGAAMTTGWCTSNPAYPRCSVQNAHAYHCGSTIMSVVRSTCKTHLTTMAPGLKKLSPLRLRDFLRKPSGSPSNSRLQDANLKEGECSPYSGYRFSPTDRTKPMSTPFFRTKAQALRERMIEQALRVSSQQNHSRPGSASRYRNQRKVEK